MINGYILANPEVRLSILRSTLRQCLEGFFPFRLNFLTSESPPEPRLLGLISSQVNNACGARWHCAKWSCVVWVTSQAAPLKFGKDWPVKRRYRKVARVTRPHTRRLTELPATPHPPPNCDPAITPDISRCFRLVANGQRQRPQEQPHCGLHCCISARRACVSSGSSHPGYFWRHCRLGTSGAGGSPGPAAGSPAESCRVIAAWMKGTAFPGSDPRSTGRPLRRRFPSTCQ